MSRPKIVDEVVKAYQETGYKPIRRGFFRKVKKCCPLGALALCKGVVNSKLGRDKRIDRVLRWANQKYGEEYVNGFLEGFDWSADVTPLFSPTEKYMKGRRHGDMVYRILCHKKMMASV